MLLRLREELLEARRLVGRAVELRIEENIPLTQPRPPLLLRTMKLYA
jgi:hypothetical protein